MFISFKFNIISIINYKFKYAKKKKFIKKVDYMLFFI